MVATFPVTCVDNFYKEPDKIREWALSLNYTPSETGNWPGVRSKPLHLIDQKFYQEFAKKFVSIFYDINLYDIEYDISTAFQLIDPLDQNPNSSKNTGWIHQDPSIFAAIIYLSPNINMSCGTSIFQPKNALAEQIVGKGAAVKNKFFLGDHVDEEEYDNAITETKNNFEESIRFNNVYNRLIAFDSTQWHAANNFYSEKQPRLTQLVFVDKLKINTPYPVDRIRNSSLL